MSGCTVTVENNFSNDSDLGKIADIYPSYLNLVSKTNER
jgi:hypothetical protein